MTDEKTGWRIEMLGGLRVLQGDHAIPSFSTRKAGVLLAYLAFFRQDSHSREYLAELLWPGEAGPTVRNRLNQTVWALRQNLPADAEILLSDRLSLRIHPSVSTDIADFYGALHQAEQASGMAAKKRSLQRAIALYRGELLPGTYEEWMESERQRLADSFQGALRELAVLAAEEQDWPLALRYVRQAIAADPLQEEAYLDGIRFSLQADRLAEALRVYRALEQMLRQEYGGVPSEEAQALLAQIEARLSQAADTPASHAQHPAGSAREAYACADVRLPDPLTLFFGREAEIDQILGFLRAGRKRLITLIGLGGSGKTRLAIEAARRFAGEFPGRIAFIPLVDVTDAAAIPEAVATGLGLERPENGAVLDLVIETLRGEPALLVLDNLEHLLEAAPFLRHLLASVPPLRLLVTSRRKLRLEGEQEIPVPPLPLPPEPHHTESLLAYPSVQLFLDRAQSVRPDFTVTPENAGDVACLCQTLEGIPLAIELCAAWAATLTPAQMQRQLESRFDLLVSRLADVPDRHRSLYAVIESSFARLPDSLSRFFYGLSVFRGGWTLEAAEALACSLQIEVGDQEEAQNARSRNGSPDGWVREALAQLLECSLIVSEMNGSEMRYRMLESLREYAAPRMASKEREQTLRAHSAHFCRLVQQAEPNLHTTRDKAFWIQRLEADYENLRLAMQTCLEQSCIEQGLQLVSDLWVFWEHTGRLTAVGEWLKHTLALTEISTVDPSMRAMGLFEQGFFAWRQGDFLTAQSALESSYQIAKEREDVWYMAHARQIQGGAACSQGKLPIARAYLEESIELFHSLGDSRWVTIATYNLGAVAEQEKHYFEAREHYQEALAYWRAVGFEERAALAIEALGNVTFRTNDPYQAQSMFLESLTILRHLGSHRGHIAECLDKIGDVALALGKMERAVKIKAAVDRLRQDIKMPTEPCNVQVQVEHLAVLLQSLGAEKFDRLWAEGQAMTLEEAIYEAQHP
ncbi:MAG TPA: tetratricopeptide repeat protein [Chthonomonadaceae bacterium]|nr:tetratricopeptide repeat protein [Chthonomonadaceae bacterium]